MSSYNEIITKRATEVRLTSHLRKCKLQRRRFRVANAMLSWKKQVHKSMFFWWSSDAEWTLALVLAGLCFSWKREEERRWRMWQRITNDVYSCLGNFLKNDGHGTKSLKYVGSWSHWSSYTSGVCFSSYEIELWLIKAGLLSMLRIA